MADFGHQFTLWRCIAGICNGRCVGAFVAFCMTAGFRRTVSRGAFRMGTVRRVALQPCGGPWATWVDGSRGGEEKDAIFFQLEGMEWGDSEFFLFWLIVFLFFTILPLFWSFLLFFHWNLLKHDRSSASLFFETPWFFGDGNNFNQIYRGCVNGQFGTLDHFLRPASVLAIAPLERCGKLERWNDICNSIDAVVFLKRHAGFTFH